MMTNGSIGLKPKEQVNKNGCKLVSIRARAKKFLGQFYILLTLVSFLFVGLILNVAQLVLTLTVRLSNNKQWKLIHKRLNGKLLYAIFAQPIFLLYSWSQMQLNITLEDVKMLEDVDKELFAIIVANHTFELDWMACFVMADQLGNMGAYKCFSKDELKYLPVIGWAFWMSDLVYVKRDWSYDRLNLDAKLNKLLDYQQVLLGIFAEGTRWTSEKHRNAVEFARSRSLEPFRYHLVPRPRGFNYTLRHFLRCQANEPERMAGKPIRVFNLEIAMPDKLTFRDFLEGKQVRADVVCEEVQLSEELRNQVINSKNENDCPKLTELLHNIYRRKDELLDNYQLNGNKFIIDSPRSGPYPIRRPTKAFVYWLLGMLTTYGTLLYLVWTRFARSSTFWSCILMIFAGGMLMLKRIEQESKPKDIKVKIV